MIKIREKFIFDKKGKKKEVVLSCRDYEELLEDLHDLAVIAERKFDKVISSAEMRKRLGI